MLDVGVVGGGPGGLVTAARLAARGFSVTVFEEHEAIGSPVHCTGVLAEEAITSLSLPREAMLNPLSRVTFVAPSGTSFSYTTPGTEAIVIDRLVFDGALARAAERAGATVVRGQRVVGLDVGDQGARLVLEGGALAQARAVVLACGANYGFQRKCGFGMPGAFLQSAQLELPCDRPGDVEVHFGHEVARKGFAWAVPVLRSAGPYVRIGVMAERAAGLHFERMVARVAERWGVTSPAVLEPRRRMLPLGPVRRSFGQRLLAVGDAAGLVKPTTGGGIYYSVVSGEIAAEVLADALEGDTLDAESLREYERRWRRRFQSELNAQHALRLMAERLSDAEIDQLFELARTDGLMPLVQRTARFNQHRALILELFKFAPSRRLLLRRISDIVA